MARRRAASQVSLSSPLGAGMCTFLPSTERRFRLAPVSEGAQLEMSERVGRGTILRCAPSLTSASRNRRYVLDKKINFLIPLSKTEKHCCDHEQTAESCGSISEQVLTPRKLVPRNSRGDNVFSLSSILQSILRNLRFSLRV